MRMRMTLTGLGCLAVLVSLSSCTDDGLDQQAFTGMKQTQVIAQLGQPHEQTQWTKTAQPVFGPIADLWQRLAVGDRIVVWIYETRHGRKELYFINDSPQVAGEFFWHHDQSKNPVY